MWFGSVVEYHLDKLYIDMSTKSKVEEQLEKLCDRMSNWTVIARMELYWK